MVQMMKRMQRAPYVGERKRPGSNSQKHVNVITLQKGNQFNVTISEMGKQGDGIAYIDGYTVFVKNTELGEKVKIRIKQVLKTVARADRLN